jgi:hypothetical protein
MRYFGASVAVLMAAITFSATPLGQPARASENERAVGTIAGMAANRIFSSNAPNANAAAIPRYEKTLMAAYTEYNPNTCVEISKGAWTVTAKPKYGTVSFGLETGSLAIGDCPGKTFTFAAIYYEWTTHNNKSATDVFDATWATPDGVYNLPFIFNITVPIVRPTGETTAFTGWLTSRGLWQQTLTPPSFDPKFDFSGETVRETSAGSLDQCWAGGSALPMASLTSHEWTVGSGNVWGPDGVGWGTNESSCPIEYYRCMQRTPCGFLLRQQMQISSPADYGDYANYGGVNNLASMIYGFTLNGSGFGAVTSQRAQGATQSEYFGSAQWNCPRSVNLSKCP